MAGLFYGGTSSDLSATVSSTAISYPVLMCAWVELNESPDADCVLALSDNGSGGSLDALQLNIETSGGTAKAIATARGRDDFVLPSACIMRLARSDCK